MNTLVSLLRDRQAWLHSGKSFLAAILALYIALLADLSRPYWAMATAYIVLQPVLGGTNARGVYRILGTVLGSAAVVVMVPGLLHVPEVLSLAMSLWLTACMFVTLLHRGPSAYVFMLAGYTAAFVGFPTILQPDTIFDTALARSEEIVLGSLCAVLVGALVFPVSIKTQVVRRVEGLMDDARAWCVQALQHQGSSAALRRRLATDLSQLDLVIPFARRDDPRHGPLHAWLAELRARLLGLLPVLAGIEDRLDDLALAAADPRLLALRDDLRGWIEDPAWPSAQALAGFRARIGELRAIADARPDGPLRNGLLLRLEELATLWYDARHLQRAIVTAEPPPPRAYGTDLRRLIRAGNRHVDWSMLTFSALATGATLFSYCLLWIAIGWSDGASGAMMAAVAGAFFAAQDDPAPSILLFLNGILFATFAAGVYLFGILPALHDFVPLVLVIAPFFLLAGLTAVRPRLFMPGMIVITNFASLLAIQNRYEADFTRYVNGAVSSVLGLVFALVVTRLFRSVGADWSARRLVRQGWRLLAAAAEGHGRQDRDRFMVRMLDLLGLLAPRLAALPADSEVAGVDMLDEVRIGLNILNLRRARAALPPVNQAAINRLLALVAAHYRARIEANRPLPPPPELKQALEASLARLGSLPPGPARDEALLGLVGLRYGLYRERHPVAPPLADPEGA
ncbi:FUSC family protein [Aerosticca soli]|uniref:Inner membrane component of tripartite multidrug resistance system n=1 Tax=Aerosticca soli TaxID=2010829 RepID=A0A2Z6E7W0_9GAMM|nr:FUSC family protein [Aerosticca soli]BBD81127.1 hypothetical protein ALSL_2503 [Aerosticca soli]